MNTRTVTLTDNRVARLHICGNYGTVTVTDLDDNILDQRVTGPSMVAMLRVASGL